MASPIVPQSTSNAVPNGSTLPISSNLLQDHFINNYTPSPDDCRFAVDLLHSLQSHAPLTLLQKIFLWTVMIIPGPIEWKLSFFNFLSTLSFTPIAATLAGGVFIIVYLYLLRKYGWRILNRKQKLIFLELTFPSTTSKSAYATEKLFSLLHNLAGQKKFRHKLLGYKKQYSLEIVANRDEGIRYILGVPILDVSVIQKSLLSFLPGLKIKEIADYLPTDMKHKSGKLGIIELKLKSDFVLPLQEHKTLGEHDPIAYLTGNMTKLKSNELIAFQAVVTPITKYSHGSYLRHIGSIQQRIYANRSLADKLFPNYLEKLIAIPWDILKFFALIVQSVIKFILSMIIAAWDTKGDTVPFFKNEAPVVVNVAETQNPYEQQLRTEVKEKIDQPMFETSLRLLVRSSNSEHYNLRVSGFLASFGSLGSAYQSLMLKTKGLMSLIFPSRFSFAARQVSLSGNPILSTSELSDIYHFPYADTTKTEDMVKSKSQPLPAPLSFKQSSTKFDNVFAKNNYGGSETAIGQTLEERRRHTYILGATGSGKTTLLSNMIYQDIVNGKGVGVLDPHGQLIEKLLSVIPKERLKDVVWFAPDDDEYPVALNLMEIKAENLTASQLQKQKSLVASNIISVIQKFYEAKYFGPRMEYVLRNTILTALETEEPTLQTILDILTNKSYRKEVVKELTNQTLKNFWVNEFEKLGSMQRNNVVSPITNKIGGLLSSPINYNILIQIKSTLDFDEIINKGKILLCNLAEGKLGEDTSMLLGATVIAKIHQAAVRRARISSTDRKPFYLFVDEFQNFATSSFTKLLSGGRKFGLRITIAEQSTSQQDNRNITNVVLANTGTVICFRTASPVDEDLMLSQFAPQVVHGDIGNLPRYRFYMRLAAIEPEAPFSGITIPITTLKDSKKVEWIIESSRKNYATKYVKKASKPTPPSAPEKPFNAKKKVSKSLESAI